MLVSRHPRLEVKILYHIQYSKAHKTTIAYRGCTHVTVYARHVHYLIWLDMNECTYIFESSKLEAGKRLTVLWRLCGVSLYDLCEFPVTAVINCHKPRGLKQHKFVVVWSLIHFWLCDLMDCSMLASPVLQHLLEFVQILRFVSTESVMLSNHLILCCPLLLLPSVFRSRIPKYKMTLTGLR